MGNEYITGAGIGGTPVCETPKNQKEREHF